MSIEIFQRVLTRAASDAAFADLLFADPERALAGCDLTPEEALSLKLMSRSDLSQYAFRPLPRPIPPAAVATKHQRSQS